MFPVKGFSSNKAFAHQEGFLYQVKMRTFCPGQKIEKSRQSLPFRIYAYFAGMMSDLSPAGSNSLIAPLPNSFLGAVKSNGRRSSA